MNSGRDGSRRPGPGSEDQLALAVLVLVGAGGFLLWRWWTSGPTPEVPDEAAGRVWDQAGTYLPIVTAGLAAAGGLWLVRRWLRRRRDLLVDQLVATSAAVMPSGFTGRHVRVTRWRWTSPRTVKVDLSPECRDDDTSWRAQLVRAVEQRLGEPVSAKWPGRGGWRLRRRLVLQVGRESRTAGEGSLASEQVQSAVALLVPGAQAYVTEVDEEDGTPRRLRVTYAETTRDMSPAWRARVVGQVGSRLGGQWRAKWDTRARSVSLERVPHLPHPVPWTPPPRTEGSPVIPYGVDEDGPLVAWELGQRQPHAAIVGPTGSGKSETMKSMTASALRLGLMSVIIAPKPVDWMSFIGMPGVAAVVTSVEDRAAAIEAIHAQMMRRNAAQAVTELERQRPDLAMTRPPASALDDIPMLVVLDEVTQLISDFNSWWAGMPKEQRVERWGSESRKCPMVGQLVEIAQLARASRIHLLLGMQRPDAQNFGDSTQMRDNLPHRVSMGALSAIGSEQQWGDRDVGRILVENIGEGVSNGMRLDADGRTAPPGEPGRFKACYIAEETLLDESFRAELAAVAPDVSLLDLGQVSPAARSIEGALAQLREQAGITSACPIRPGLDAAAEPTEPAVGTRESETGPADDGVSRLVELTRRSAEAEPAQDLSVEPETDRAGRAWETCPVTQLAADDVLLVEESDPATVLAADWVEDEATGESLFRLLVDTSDGEAEWDLDPDDTVHRLLSGRSSAA